MLAEHENAQISWCRGCHGYSLVYGNCCLSFTKNELKQFKEVLDGFTPADFTYQFLGEPHVLLKNQFANIGFSLTAQDAQLLEEVIDQALTVQEVFKIVYE
jgi:hypothetical protein